MLFATKADGIPRLRLQPLVVAGIHGRRSQIKQNQGPLHINHAAVQLLSTLYNLTISSSHCSSCACDCAHVCVLYKFFHLFSFHSRRRMRSKTWTWFMLWVTQGDFPCCHPPYAVVRRRPSPFGAQSQCLHSQVVLLQRDIQLSPLWPTFGFDEVL